MKRRVGQRYIHNFPSVKEPPVIFSISTLPYTDANISCPHAAKPGPKSDTKKTPI